MCENLTGGFGIIPSWCMIGSIFLCSKDTTGRYEHAMCEVLLFRARTGKVFAYLLCFDIKLKKSRSGFDLVTVFISKQKKPQKTKAQASLCIWAV